MWSATTPRRTFLPQVWQTAITIIPGSMLNQLRLHHRHPPPLPQEIGFRNGMAVRIGFLSALIAFILFVLPLPFPRPQTTHIGPRRGLSGGLPVRPADRT